MILRIRENEEFEMPPEKPEGFVRTLNNMGFMLTHKDEYVQAFIDYSFKIKGPVLEIGAAYGNVVLEVLGSGNKVIANDIDSGHLDILIERADKKAQKNLTLNNQAFPYETSFKENSIGAILIARVLHFFDGATIDDSAETLYKWLKPGGKVFITAETPFLRNLQTFHGVYQMRKLNGVKWPGWIDNFALYDPARAKALPKHMNLLDSDILTRVLEKAGFVIERTSYISRDSFPKDIRWDGRESVGIIAVKP